MAKSKTSVKQKESTKNIPLARLKPNARVRPYNPTREILQGDLMGKAILECLKNNDPEGVMEVISIYLDTLNRVKTAEKANLSRSTIYHSLRHKNPTIKTLAKIMSVHNPMEAKKS